MLFLYIDKIIFFIIFFSSITIDKQIKKYLFTVFVISLGSIYLLSINTTIIVCISIIYITRLICLKIMIKVKWLTIFYWITHLISEISISIPTISIQTIILVLLVRNLSNQLMFIIIFKINEKDLIICLPLSFSLSNKKVCKYITRALLFSKLSIKIIIFLILLISSIFNDIRKLTFSKPGLIIRVMVYMIFRQSKNLWYKHTEVLRFSIFQIYLSIF